MKQSQYEFIIKCIQFGAPALANELVAAFNEVISMSNEYTNAKIKAEEEKRRAQIVEQEKAKDIAASQRADLGIKKTTK